MTIIFTKNCNKMKNETNEKKTKQNLTSSLGEFTGFTGKI